MITSPGRIGLTQIHGKVGAGIRFGQWLNGSGFEDYEHAYMDLGDGTGIEAEPGGARIFSLDKYDPKTVHWCDGIYANTPPQLRQAIADEARRLEHTPYSFLDYDAIALHRLGLDTRFLRNYIGKTGHLICSQLVDLASTRGGHQIFTDDRWPGFVAPGDLYLEDLKQTFGSIKVWNRKTREWRLE